MTTVITITARHQNQPKICSFTYQHSAKTWLLISGFLPFSEDPNQYLNPFTGECAQLQIYR